MIIGATPSRTIRLTDDLGELLRSSWVNGGGQITSKNGILTTYSPGTTERAWSYINIYAPSGSVIEVSCEARQVTSESQGRIAIDQFEKNDQVGGGVVDYVEMTDTQWRPYKLVRAGNDKKPFSAVTFGLWYDKVGKAEFRNIIINVYNVQAPSPETRMCMLKGVDGTWIIDDSPGRFTNIGVTNVTATDTYLSVEWTPMQSWQRPIVSAQMDHYGGHADCNALITGGEKHRVSVFIVKTATGTVVNPKELKGTWYLEVMAFAL